MTATAQPPATVPAAPPVRVTVPPPDDLAGLLPEWRRHLRAGNKASSTIASYVRCAEALLGCLADRGMPTTASGVTREHLEAFLADLLERVSAATAAKPRVTQRPLPADEQRRRRSHRLARGGPAGSGRGLARCAPRTAPPGTAALPEHHDKALIEVHVLDGEPHQLGGADPGVEEQPHHHQVALGLERLALAGVKQLLQAVVGGHRHRLLREVLDRRCADAGIGHLNPHAFGHFFAHSWLANGGLEGDLMALAGWLAVEGDADPLREVHCVVAGGRGAQAGGAGRPILTAGNRRDLSAYGYNTPPLMGLRGRPCGSAHPVR